jgi:4-amino-4-deoxy-L-arabinose transferase-like glycosyltransferase
VQPYLYGDHPPLLGLTIAAYLLIFGYHFWVVRLTPIVATLIALVLFYLLMQLLFDRRVATFAAALFATFPITTYYGRSVTQEAETLCCVMGMALGYALWRRTGRNRWLIGVAACVLLGGLYDWPMFFFCWLLFILDTLRARRVNWLVALATAGAGTAIFALMLTQIAWASGWSLAHLEYQFFYRSAPIPLTHWVHRLGFFNILDYGIWVTPAALIALYVVWREFRREGLSLRVQYVLLFSLAALTHVVVFRQGSYLHDYWQFYLIPFYALTLGWGGSELAKVLANRLAKPTARWLAQLRLAPLRIAPQTMIMVSFAVLALVVAWPFIDHFYSAWPWSPPPHLSVSLF